jgi:hypothetical protein
MPCRRSALALSALMAAVIVPFPVAAQLPSAESDVVVVDAGAEPRRELRYAWEPDQRERLQSVIVVSVDASESGREMMQMELPVSMAIEATVTKVERDGSAWVALAFEEMVFGPLSASGDGVPDGDLAAAGFDEAMAAVTPLLSETRVWQQIDDRGQVLKTNVRFPDGFPPEAQQQIAQTTSSVAVLPAEPVGVGARWETTGTSVNQGVAVSVSTTMELIEMDGEDVTISMSLRLADGFDTLLPAVTPFDEFSLDGGGTYRLDLGGVYPREASVSMTMGMGGELPNDAGTIVPIEMHVGVGMTMSTTEPS